MVKKETKVVKNPKNKKDEKVETKFHMPSSLSIVLIVLAGVIVLTWILHWSGANYEMPVYNDEGDKIGTTSERVEVAGILSFGSAIAGGFIDAGALIMYLFVLGGFIELMMRTGAMEQGIKALVNKLENKEIILIPLLFLIFSLGGTTYGMQEETIGFFILIVPFLILAGFDAMTGLLVILLGTTTGFAASTVNPFAIGAAVDSLPDDIPVTSGQAIGARLVIWIIFTIIGVTFVTSYAWYVLKKPSASFVANDHKKNLAWAQKNFGSMDKNDFRKTTRREMIGLILFASAFLIMVICYLPWGSFFNGYDANINPDEGGHGYIWDDFYLGWLFNGMNYPGYWYFGELITLFLIFTFAIGFTFKMKIKEISEAMWKGAKGILPVAIIIGVARAIPQVMEGTGTDLYLVGVMTTGLKDLSSFSFLIIIFLVFLVLTCFIPSTSGLASLSMPIIGALTMDIFAKNSGVDQLQMVAYMIIMFSIGTGIVNMFIPTQAIVLASTESAKVPYLKMLKPVLIYAGILTIFTIAVVAPSLGALAKT